MAKKTSEGELTALGADIWSCQMCPTSQMDGSSSATDLGRFWPSCPETAGISDCSQFLTLWDRQPLLLCTEFAEVR